MTTTATDPSPAEILADMMRRKARRRRSIAVVLLLLAIPLGLLGWRVGRHAIAETYLTTRGYGISWRVEPYQWARGGSTSAEVAPRILGFIGPDRSAGDIGYLAWLHRVDRLDLARIDGLTDGELAILAELPDLVALNLDQRQGNQWYDRRSDRPTDTSMGLIGSLGRLRELNLSGTRITDAGVARLAGLADLRFLELDKTDVSDASVATLAAFGKLAYVGLRGTKVTAEGAARLKDRLPETDVNHESIPSPR